MRTSFKNIWKKKNATDDVSSQALKGAIEPDSSKIDSMH